MSSSSRKLPNLDNTADKEQIRYERRLARQRKLDMMEAAAAGKIYDEDASSDVRSRSASPFRTVSPFTMTPHQAMESAQNFLFDDDDEDSPPGHQSMPSRMDYTSTQAGGQMNDGNASNPGLGSRMANTIMGSLMFSTRELDSSDEDANRISLAPKGNSVFDDSDGDVNYEDEFIPYKTKRGCCDKIGDCCTATFHTVLGIVGVLCDFVKDFFAMVNWQKFCMILAVPAGTALFILGIVAIVARTGSGSSSGSANKPTPSDKLPPIENEVRYGQFRTAIVDSKYTSAEDIDSLGTAQNYALRWLTDDDPGQISHDDDAMLQRYALATFYYSTYVYAQVEDSQSGHKTSTWRSADYWMSDKGICMWFGVTCRDYGSQSGHYNANFNVKHLNLTKNYVRGFLPSEMAALQHLEILDLGMNGLSGAIPTSFGTFTGLSELYLEDNSMTGTLPTELGSLSVLRDFYLGTNKFQGTISPELAFMTELVALGLDENLFTGTIPEQIYRLCTNLKVLYLDANYLRGTLSSAVADLKDLTDLRMRKNALTGSIPEAIASLTNLELLYLDDNKFTGTIPRDWDSMERLEELQLYKNQLTGTLPEILHTALKVLYADNNKLKGTLPVAYGDLGDLRVLYLFNNEIEGTIPAELGKLDALVDLQLNDNTFTGPLPSEMGDCEKLEKLEIQGNQLTGNIPTEFGNMQHLQMFKIHRNKFEGIFPSEVCDAKSQYELAFVSADCNTDNGGTLRCTCCSACYP